MLLLTSTTDMLRLVLGASASVTVSVSAVDNNAGTIEVPDLVPIGAIVAAGTTPICAAPAVGKQRNVKSIMVTNNHATASTSALVQRYNGTYSADLFGVVLLPGENIVFSEDGEWKHHDAQGAEYGFNPQVQAPYGITGAIAESVPRNLAGVNIAAVTSGTMVMQAIWLPAGKGISSLVAMSGTTASATQTNRWMALYDQNRGLLRQSPDLTTTVLAANALYTAPITSYTTTYSGIYYIAIMTAATTPNSLVGVTAASNAAIKGLTPILSGTSTTGVTTTAPATAAAITATVNTYWVAVT